MSRRPWQHTGGAEVHLHSFSTSALDGVEWLTLRWLMSYIYIWSTHSWSFYITHDDAAQSVGILWTSDQLVAETSTWQHTTLTTDKYPCQRWDSNPRSQQASGLWPLACCVVVCDLETSRMGAPYIYDISRLRVMCTVKLFKCSW